MRVLASALAAALIAGAAPALSDTPDAKKGARSSAATAATAGIAQPEQPVRRKSASRKATTSAARPPAAADQTGRVLVIPAQPNLRSRVSGWLSGWRGTPASTAGEQATAEAEPQQTVKKSRRSVSKSKARSARKAKSQQVAARSTLRRSAKRTGKSPPPKPAEEEVASLEQPDADFGTEVAETASIADAPAESLTGQTETGQTETGGTSVEPPSPVRTLLVQPAYAPAPQSVQVPPARTHSPLADLPAAIIMEPLQGAPRVSAPAPQVALPEPVAPPPVLVETALAVARAEPAVDLGPLPPATSRVAKMVETVDEKSWWDNEGAPVVMNFRDCISEYAGRAAAARRDLSLGDLVLQASTGECRAAFDEMMVVMTVRFGSERLEPLMGRLIDDTFLPAAREAVDQATRTATTGQ